ncbi:MAG: hypothetical protein AB8F65_09540 [Woeseiaceae bacterium]
MSGAMDRIRALPIFLLVLAALMSGSALWCFIRSVPAPKLGGILAGIAVGLWFAAATSMRRRQMILQDGSNETG